MYKKLIDLIKRSDKIVFFGGAGVSTESGIPDFRSSDGIFHTKTKYGCSPETVVSHSFFKERPEDFYEFYDSRMIIRNVKPNITHNVLAQLEQKGKLLGVVTQNIDGLHQLAGSKNVYELHGSIRRYFCMRCGLVYDLDYVEDPKNRKKGSYIPYCKCGGMLKPDVVLYEEPLDDTVVTGAIKAIKKADLLIVGGTSLIVYPAAGLLNYFRGKHLVLINRDETSYDSQAEIVIHDNLGKVFGAIQQALDEDGKTLK